MTASTALWASMPGTVAGPSSGWLLPKHSVQQFAGAPLLYDDGGTGQIVADFGECIDACIGSTTRPPIGLAPVAADPAPTIGKVVDIHGQPCVTMAVDINIGLIRYSKSPARITYDWSTAQQGDSGSLVRDWQSNAPVAMHQGTAEMCDSHGTPLADPVSLQPIRHGFGLCLYQLEAMKSLVFET